MTIVFKRAEHNFEEGTCSHIEKVCSHYLDENDQILLTRYGVCNMNTAGADIKYFDDYTLTD
jgi:hypothetical protein